MRKLGECRIQSCMNTRLWSESSVMVFKSIKNKLSNFLYWGFDKLGMRLLSKTMDYASKNRKKGGSPIMTSLLFLVDHC